uniref:Serine/threonine-protein phosphatase n=1 Tax=Chrysotila carterae TaxID=13221 RepID=A0A7S4AY70_CHRCT|mmetsp:Transcript_44431/g.96821  ORF Transcript_44431/g.96821 Transcript_44431/m.96821 type:complete len:610 (+) Transcript_44431:89-1918(+)
MAESEHQDGSLQTCAGNDTQDGSEAIPSEHAQAEAVLTRVDADFKTSSERHRKEVPTDQEGTVHLESGETAVLHSNTEEARRPASAFATEDPTAEALASTTVPAKQPSSQGDAQDVVRNDSSQQELGNLSQTTTGDRSALVSHRQDSVQSSEENFVHESQSLPGGSSTTANRKKRRASSPTLSRRAIVSDWNGGMERTISIDRLPEEGKRLNRTKLSRVPSEEGVERRVLRSLLRPREWTPPADRSFPISASDILQLCETVQPVIEAEPTLLKLSAPIKIFGDLHGQYSDLMRLFDQYGTPSKEQGDINMVDYLFLGDFVDRGTHSLETVVLLLALKKHYPRQIALVRGNHESPEVNSRDGFLHECVERLGSKAAGLEVWRRLNRLFEWMPVAALVNGCILCVHGGIGRCLTSLQQIRDLERPLRMGSHDAELLLDLLWSDPTKSDAVSGVHLNGERGSPVVCFGPDRVKTFLTANDLKLIVRGHECVMDGFQRFAGGRLITVFSATNYCNRWRNAGAILLISKDLEIVPKIIFPVAHIEDAWLRFGEADASEELQHMRPPTPPRDSEDLEDEEEAGCDGSTDTHGDEVSQGGAAADSGDGRQDASDVA